MNWRHSHYCNPIYFRTYTMFWKILLQAQLAQCFKIVKHCNIGFVTLNIRILWTARDVCLILETTIPDVFVCRSDIKIGSIAKLQYLLRQFVIHDSHRYFWFYLQFRNKYDCVLSFVCYLILVVEGFVVFDSNLFYAQ